MVRDGLLFLPRVRVPSASRGQPRMFFAASPKSHPISRFKSLACWRFHGPSRGPKHAARASWPIWATCGTSAPLVRRPTASPPRAPTWT